jgi:hypothetical protein
LHDHSLTEFETHIKRLKFCQQAISRGEYCWFVVCFL